MGGILSFIPQFFPSKATYSVNDMPDLTGKVAIVTGGNSGIGKETVKALLNRNAKVYIAARNEEKSQEVIKDLKEQTGKEAHFLKLDLADLPIVKAAAEEFQRKETQLHILFNNGGVMLPGNAVTAQGYDMQFGTNVVGHFYFTKQLLPILLSTAKSSPDGKVRVVNTASAMHELSSLDFNTFKDGPASRRKNGWLLYGQSKLGNVIFAKELARRYGDQGIVSTSLHPGLIKSNLQRDLSYIEDLSQRPLYYTPAQGALTQLYAGTSPEGAEFNGKHLFAWARPGTSSKTSEDPKLGEELWTWLEEQVKDI